MEVWWDIIVDIIIVDIVVLNFKQIQEIFAEGAAIYLKHVEVFSPAVFYELALVGFIATN